MNKPKLAKIKKKSKKEECDKIVEKAQEESLIHLFEEDIDEAVF